MADSVKPPSRVPVVEPKTVPPPPTLKVEKTEKDVLLENIKTILMEYKQESDIPTNHEYWRLVNKYRSL